MRGRRISSKMPVFGMPKLPLPTSALMLAQAKSRARHRSRALWGEWGLECALLAGDCAVPAVSVVFVLSALSLFGDCVQAGFVLVEGWFREECAGDLACARCANCVVCVVCVCRASRLLCALVLCVLVWGAFASCVQGFGVLSVCALVWCGGFLTLIARALRARYVWGSPVSQRAWRLDSESVPLPRCNHTFAGSLGRRQAGRFG